jgi:hypothetical protein
MTDWNITGITSFNVPALASTGAVTGSNLNVANWDTAYGWGDHAGVYEPVDADILRADTADVVTAYIDFNATDAAPAALHSRLTRNMLYLDGKEAIDGNDAWLRLNQNGDFTSGVYTPNAIRTDGRVFVSSTIYIENGTTGSIQVGDTGIGYTADIGCRNSSYCHFDTTATAGKASHGNYLYHASTAYDNDQNGQITFGTGAASGGTTGDIHFQYT